MNKLDVIQWLMELPYEIELAEIDLIAAQSEVAIAKGDLAEREGDLLLSGAIDGKNAEQRAAQLRQLTADARQNIANAERKLAESRARLNKMQNEFQALRTVAGLIGGEVA